MPPATARGDGGAPGVAEPSEGEARSLDDLAREAYAAIGDGRFGAARRLLDRYEEPTPQCSGAASTTRLANGGMRVVAPRGLVTTNGAGMIVTHEVVSGCLRRADDSLRVTTTETTLRFAEHGRSAELIHEVNDHPLAQSIFVSSFWVLGVDISGELLAMNRRDGAILRGRHGADASNASHWMFPVGAVPVDDHIVVDHGTKLSLLHAEGRSVDVRGCRGKLLAAERTENGEQALHVTVADDSDDTRLCLVRDDGTTRKVVALGSATCGLESAVTCPYTLQASTPRLLGFGSMRGQVELVDAVTGRIFSVPLPAGSVVDALSPGGFFTCGGDELCVSYRRSASGDVGVSAVRMSKGTLTTRVVARRTDAEKRADPDNEWCVLAGLPVPKAVCDAE